MPNGTGMERDEGFLTGPEKVVYGIRRALMSCIQNCS